MSQWLKMDLHLHSKEDPIDGYLEHPAEKLIYAAAQQGFKVLALTLHCQQWENPELEELARELGIVLIRGVEQNIEGHHVLLLNFPREISESIESFQDLKRHKTPERLVIAPHAFYPGSICLGNKVFEHQELFDAIEYSSFYFKWWNPNILAVKAAEKLNKPVLGNSDTHTMEQFGLTYTEIKCNPEVSSVISAIQAGQVRLVSRPMNLKEAFSITWKVVIRNKIPYTSWNRASYSPEEYRRNHATKYYETNKSIGKKKIPV